ncbi:MAG: DUF192 domain-containing protein [Candidatus Omnitrophota bacterium]|nr:DUF192 domain-containing protein [Candidatus Omnitrophota bacterium]
MQRPSQPVQVCAANVCVNVEVVSGKEDTQRGLQGRKGLGHNRGMLFVFERDDRHRFWMKDMKFPLDILWLDSSGGIVAVGENLPPCPADPCPVYGPPANARYVLEVSAGFSRAHDLKPGVRVSIHHLPAVFRP